MVKRLPPKELARLAMVASLVVAVIAGGWALGLWVADPNTLPVQVVRMEGNFTHLTTAALEEAVTPHVRGGFFSVDVEAIKRAAQALPWVDRVSVRRIWPSTLRIRVEEHQPLAHWGGNELINVRGERFRPDPKTVPAGLPRFDGAEGLEGLMAERYRVMAEELRPLGLEIAALAVDARRSWRMGLSNGAVVLLGREAADRRLERFVQFYPGALAARAGEIRRVDMRYPNGFAVDWKQAAEAEVQRG